MEPKRAALVGGSTDDSSASSADGHPAPDVAKRSDLPTESSSESQWLQQLRHQLTPPRLGRVGPYELLEELGGGGQGIVYKARQPGTERTVAIKRMHARGPESAVRFAREPRTAASLSHPNIVNVLTSEVIDGQAILVMDFIDGQPVDRWLAARNADIQAVVSLFERLTRAVAYAHQRGVIHRDLKPSNVLVDAQGEPHVLDFGLARLLSPFVADSLFQTYTTTFVGTPAYASPEHFEAEAVAVDVRSDVYSIGVMLYQALAGRLPYSCGQRFTDLMKEIVEVDPPRPSTVAPRVPRELELIVMKALAKEADQRYQTMDAFADDLRRFQAGESVQAHPPSFNYQFRKLVRRHKVIFLSGSLIVALTIAFGIVSTILASREHAARKKAELSAYTGHIAASAAAIRERNSADAQQHLSLTPKSLRNWEWRYFSRLADQSIATYPTKGAGFVVVDAKGRPLLTVRGGEFLDRHAQGKLPKDAIALHFADQGAAISPNLNLAIVSPYMTTITTNFVLLDVTSGRRLATWSKVNSELPVLSSRGDIAFLSGSTLFLKPAETIGGTHDLSSDDPIPSLELSSFRLDLHSAKIGQCVFTPDGARLATSAGDGTIKIVDVQSRTLIATIESGERNHWALAFNSDGTRIAAGSWDKRLTLWDIETRKPLWTSTGHEELIRDVCFSPDGTLIATASYDNSIGIWDAASGEARTRLWGHTAWPCRVRFLPDGQSLASLDVAGNVKVWPSRMKEPIAAGDFNRISMLVVPPLNAGPVWMAVSESPDATWNNSRISIVDLRSRQKRFEVCKTTEHQLALGKALTVSPGGQWLAAGLPGGRIVVWHCCDIAQALEESESRPLLPAFTLGTDWQSSEASAEEIAHSKSYEKPPTCPMSLSFSADSRLLAVGRSSGQCDIWNMNTMSQVSSWKSPTGAAECNCAFYPDGDRIVCFFRDNSIVVRRVGDGQILMQTRLESIPQGQAENSTQHCRCSFSPDGRYFVAAVHSKDVFLIDGNDLSIERKFSGHSDSVMEVAFSPDGARLATAGLDNVIRLWDFASGQSVATLHGHKSSPFSLIFTPNGNTLISGGLDNTIRFWDAPPSEAIPIE